MMLVKCRRWPGNHCWCLTELPVRSCRVHRSPLCVEDRHHCVHLYMRILLQNVADQIIAEILSAWHIMFMQLPQPIACRLSAKEWYKLGDQYTSVRNAVGVGGKTRIGLKVG